MVVCVCEYSKWNPIAWGLWIKHYVLSLLANSFPLHTPDSQPQTWLWFPFPKLDLVPFRKGEWLTHREGRLLEPNLLDDSSGWQAHPVPPPVPGETLSSEGVAFFCWCFSMEYQTGGLVLSPERPAYQVFAAFIFVLFLKLKSSHTYLRFYWIKTWMGDFCLFVF